MVFAYGNETSHMINAPEVVIIKGEDYLSIYTSRRSYINSKPISYKLIQSEMSEILDNGGIIVMKNASDYALTPAWAELERGNPTDMVMHIEDHIFDIDLEIKKAAGHTVNLQDALGPTLGEKYILHTERYAPIWKKGSKDTIVKQCIEDATIILNLANYCSDAGLIKVRSRATGVIEGVDVEW